ncbi:YkoF family thiamine/hydroxymethylpyrimidine-binding protein [Coraliomargarita algicola]|uniref:YkoF family thiamine/hydroxymethylpyrimidine-binding protein n=1 Tax=Coraliomargarita algicola TaxID=3092156 RepID=A0ABZ0RHD1_9BACT|nr:YkoF family thiamine/hydroxymethylpyrimidine-binding protein [Coraliomargarita sp. J2-16]WPJ94908.1 YkoF family thiamine/hydroxymethylpyrimidine-binding protein [Coraliomargarita sp. J2-16]
MMEKTDPLISIQISVYALDGKVREAVHCYLDALDATGIQRETGSMSTVVWGEAAQVWSALQSAYETVAAQHEVIVNTTMSNAAPLPARASGQR